MELDPDKLELIEQNRLHNAVPAFQISLDRGQPRHHIRTVISLNDFSQERNQILLELVCFLLELCI